MNWRNISAGEVKHDIMVYIEMFYNSQQLHSFNGYLSPNDFEQILLSFIGLSVHYLTTSLLTYPFYLSLLS